MVQQRTIVVDPWFSFCGRIIDFHYAFCELAAEPKIYLLPII